MVKSMTGYGRARETRNKRDITVEVRSVNNRYLDCTVKMPRAYIFAEDALKARVQKTISRGKVDVFVTIDTSAADVAVVSVNEPLARGYYDALTKLQDTFSLEGEITAVTLARFPDVLTVTKAEEDVETISADICAVLDEALAAYDTMRSVEGRKLAEDIAGRVTTIETVVGKVEERSPQTVAAYRERLENKMREVLQSTAIDESRILTEAAIFADKIAVDEETHRLLVHSDLVGEDRCGRGDGASAQPYCPTAGHAPEQRAGGPEAGFPDPGGQPGVQYHRLQVQRFDHRPGRGEYEGRGGEDPRTGPEY